MSDFFGGVLSGNIRFTDARINGDGPLPTSLSGPEGINGDADGRYNFNDSLLSGITPYALAGQGRMGSDRNYQQIPHRKQFVVPPVFLPDSDVHTDQTFEMSHGVDMGDIAFILNVKHKRFLLCPPPYGFTAQDEDHSMPNYNVFLNICTVNYLLSGMYNYIVTSAYEGKQLVDKNQAWGRLLMCFGVEKRVQHVFRTFKWIYLDEKHLHTTEVEKMKHLKRCFAYMNFQCMYILRQIIRTNIIPLGICAMSEKQGGQHEVGLKPVQAAASFYTTMTVDGQNRDLVNIWRSCDINGGDFLILRLDFVPNADISYSTTKRLYVLNHYYKDTVTKTLSMHNFTMGTWQLIPDTFSFSHKRKCDHFEECIKTMLINFNHNPEEKQMEFEIRCMLDFKTQGYWHIGQVYTKKQSFSEVLAPCNDMEMMQGQLLQINFAPVWKGDPIYHEESRHGTPKDKYFKFYKWERVLFSVADQSSADNPRSGDQAPYGDTAGQSLERVMGPMRDIFTPSNPSRDEVSSGMVSGVIQKRQITASDIVLDLKIAEPSVGDKDGSGEARHRKKQALPQDVQAQPPAMQPPALQPQAIEKKDAAEESLSLKTSSVSAAAAADAFEKELDKIYTEHAAKSKPVVPKTKTVKAASNLAQAPASNEGAGVNS
jgi:hypothetical protein